MKASQHIAISALLGTLVAAAFRSVAAGFACFLGGVLLDLDHLLDYYLNHGLRFDVGHFFKTFRQEILNHVVVFLHAWEWIFLSVLILWMRGWPDVASGAVIGTAAHLLLDNIFNKHGAAAYFFTCRLRHRFSGKPFYGQREYSERLAAMNGQWKRGNQEP